MKNTLFLIILTLFVPISGTILYFSSNDLLISEDIGIDEEEEDNSGSLSHRDRIDLAWQQEFERTKDPALGYVPYERMLVAKDYMNKKQALNSNKRMATSISGITWTERGPNNQGGRTRAILVDLNDATRKTVFAGGVGGGIWKTTDITVASPTWVPMDDFFGNLAVTAIVQSTSNPQIMYFGTGEGYNNADAVRGLGIWKSTNGGNTWAQLASTDNSVSFRNIQRLVLTSAGTLLAATNSGVRRSTDGGTTWAVVTGSGSRVYDVEVAANGDVYCSLSGVIRKSTNDGVTWTTLSLPVVGGRIELGLALSDANYVYAAVATSGGTAMTAFILSTDAGANWATLNLPTEAFSQAWYDLAFSIDPNNKNVIYTGGLDLHKSSDGGSTWTKISNWTGGTPQFVHADHHLVYFEPGSSDVIYFGNDGGVFRTTNGTAVLPTIANKGNNYRTVQFYGCAIHPTAGSNLFLAGAQDNGSHKFTSAGLGATTQPTGGDGAFCHIDQDNPTYMFTQYVYNQYRRSTNGGTSFTTVSGALNFESSIGQFINPTDYDNTGNDMYGAHNSGKYFFWADAPTSNTADSASITQFGGGKVTAVTCSDATSGTVWFGLNNGRVVKVDNAASGTPTGTLLNTGLPGTSVSCIALDPYNENHILVTYFSFGVNSIWESTNAGVSWNSAEGNIPDMPVRWALFNPYNTDQAMVATELGVWSTDNLNGGTTDWQPTNTGLANVRVDMLQLRSADNVVIASTHGRGLFSTIIPNPTPVALSELEGAFSDHNVLLKWFTYSEINNEGFQIERSSDGINFSSIGFVQGANNSTSVIQYGFTDINAFDHLYYYRLKQVDVDGRFTYSQIILVNKKEVGSFGIKNVFPNPANKELTIAFSSEFDDLEIKIVDQSGKELFKIQNENLQEPVLTVNVSFLSAGQYLLIVNRKGKLAYSKFTKL